jgi:hypothetical protein
MNTGWLLWLGLCRLGYTEQANELARRLARAVDTSSLREYYDPYDGAGMGQHQFAWSTLVLELLHPLT